MANPAAVKGLIFIGIQKWLREKYGEPGFQKFLAGMPEAERKLWQDKTILPISWVPADVYIHCHKTIEKVWGTGDGKLFQEGAAAVAFYDLGSVMRFFMKIGTPAFVASRFPSIWKQYFNQGEYVIQLSESHALEAYMENADSYGISGCLGTMGWTRKALEYAGAKNLQLEHSECLFKGKSQCVFRYTWA